MTSTNISIAFSPQIPLPQESLRAFADADAKKKEVAAAILPPKTPASMEDIVLLDTLRRAKASLQSSPFALDSEHAAPVRDNLKMLVALAEKKLTGVEPAPASAAAIEATPAEPIPSLQRADAGSLAAIGDRLAAAGQHKQAIMLYMAADMNQADQTDVRYVVHAGESLLALGQLEQAEEAFLLAQNQNIKNGGDVSMPDLHAQIDQLLTTARTAIASGGSAPDRPRSNEAATQKTASSSFFNDTNDQDIDIDFLLSELGKLQHDTSQLRIESEQDAIKANRDIRDQQITQKLEAILARNKAKAEREAAEGKMNFWSKLSKGLGMAAMLLGIVFAPFTGGLSLLGTAYMAIDFGLELGEHFSGVKMSIQSGLQIACEKIIEFCASGSSTAEDRQFWAGVLGIVVNVIAMIAVTAVSAGAGTSKLVKALPNILRKAGILKNNNVDKINTAVTFTFKNGKTATVTGKNAPTTSSTYRNILKVNHGVQIGALAVGGGTALYGGVCAFDTAEAGMELNSADVQQAEIEKRQIRLDKLFEQCSDDLKLVAKEWQRDIELLAEILSGNIENRGKAINALFHRPHLAA